MVEQLDDVEARCRETMRLKPVAPLMPQQALLYSTVGGVQITAGMIVFGLMRVDLISDARVPQHFDIEVVGTADGQPPVKQMNFTMPPMGLPMRLRTRTT
jgi:hypothetical protein